MRKFALITLIAYLFIALTPLALAADEENPTAGEDSLDNIKLCAEAIPATEENLTELQEENEALTGYSASNCGVAVGGFFEKGDCTADGKVITEISEVIAGTTEVDDNVIIDVYRGNCCLYYNSDANKCLEEVSIYANSFTTCNDNATNCEKRQWIIGSSGAGIIKVYIKQLYGFAAGVIGFIVMVTIVINGIRISVSGVSGDITAAKTKILQAISALVLLFLSGLILYTINPSFFG